jgi:hypothetical protein
MRHTIALLTYPSNGRVADSSAFGQARHGVGREGTGNAVTSAGVSTVGGLSLGRVGLAGSCLGVEVRTNSPEI